MEADGDFLWWLGRFVGTWRTEAGTYRVARAPNGFPEAWEVSTRTWVPLETALRIGTQVEAATGLGPRPVALSRPLMETWLTPEDLHALRGAWHVSSGMTKIVERIEQRMAELDVPERKRRWLQFWAREADQQPADRDVAYLDELRAAFLAEQRQQGG